VKLAPGIRMTCAAAAMLVLAPHASAQSASGRDDRLAVMASGSTLTNTNGGWGASALWLHNFSASTLLGLGGEHQTIGDARWSFGRLTFNQGFGAASSRTNVYLEGSVGSGRDRAHSYDYDIVAAGLYQNFTRQLVAQLEDKWIDVDTTRGHLPKAAIGYLWSTRLQTTVGYTRSVSGTLDTHQGLARIDGYTKTMNLFAGTAIGKTATITINVPVGGPSKFAHEYYVGAGRDFARADTKVILDYIRLTDSNHWTLSFNATLHKRIAAR
jgi:hypothetical protein